MDVILSAWNAVERKSNAQVMQLPKGSRIHRFDRASRTYFR